jgi:hypothetical protein
MAGHLKRLIKPQPPYGTLTEIGGQKSNRKETSMNRYVPIIFFLLCVATPICGWSADRMQFWNLTGTKITNLYLAPTGTTKWGPNQCANDADGSVDPDERLKLVGLTAGRYDVKLADASGRTCIVKDVALESGKAYAFSISESELKDCSK